MRRSWIVGAATALVVCVLLAVLSLVTLPGPREVMAAGARTLPSEDEVRFLVERPEETSGAEHATLVGRLRTDDPTFSGAFELVVESTVSRFERRHLLEVDDAFRLDGLAPGILRIELREPRQPLQWWIEELSLRFFRPYQRRFGSCELALGPGETRVDVALGLDPAASCRVIGWLIGVNEDPSLRYRVSVGRRKQEVTTDGSFDLGLLSPDRDWLNVYACAQGDESGWFQIAAEKLDLQGGEMRTLQIDVPHVARVSPDVRIRGSSGVPQDVWVHYRASDDTAFGHGSRLRTVLLPEGNHRVVVCAEGGRLKHTTLEVPGQTDELRPLFELEPASPRPILCTDPSGAPLAASSITVIGAPGGIFLESGAGSATDEAGVADLGFLADGTYTLWARTGDGMRQASLEQGATSAVFEKIGRYIIKTD